MQPGEKILKSERCGDAGPALGEGVRSRREVLGLAAAGAGALAVGGAAAEAVLAATTKPSAKQDRKILNFALTLERLQAGFYRTALERGALKGELREFAEVVGGNERAHVAFLEKALGPAARPAPTFDFTAATGGPRRFATTARMLEDAGVLAYNGQAANLTKPTLAAAAEIVSVEGRHAAWIRDILGLPPAPNAADAGAESAVIIRQLTASGLLR